MVTRICAANPQKTASGRDESVCGHNQLPRQSSHLCCLKSNKERTKFAPVDCSTASSSDRLLENDLRSIPDICQWISCRRWQGSVTIRKWFGGMRRSSNRSDHEQNGRHLRKHRFQAQPSPHHLSQSPPLYPVAYPKSELACLRRHPLFASVSPRGFLSSLITAPEWPNHSDQRTPQAPWRPPSVSREQWTSPRNLGCSGSSSPWKE